MSLALYTIITLDLTVAGFEIVDGPWGLFAFLRAVDGSGIVNPGALVQVRSERDAEDAPMGLGNTFASPGTKRWRVSWAAQAGIIVTIGFAQNAKVINWSTTPPILEISGAIEMLAGASISHIADLSIAATTAALIVASSATVREVILTSPATNVREFRIGTDAASATQGLWLAPGGLISLASRGDIGAYNPHSAAQVINSLRINSS